MRILLFAVLCSIPLSASLIPIGLVPSGGQGIGNVNTILSFSSPGASSDQSGCVAAGSGGAVITGAGACVSGFDGEDEQAGNNVYTLSGLGITSAANLQLIVNANEPGGGNQSITFNSVALTLWGADGALLGAFYTAAPYTIPNPEAGIGNAGYAFVLDADQGEDFNDIVNAFPSAYVGASANATGAQGGFDTVSIRAVDAAAIPEPGTWLLLAGAIPVLAYLGNRKK